MHLPTAPGPRKGAMLDRDHADFVSQTYLGVVWMARWECALNVKSKNKLLSTVKEYSKTGGTALNSLLSKAWPLNKAQSVLATPYYSYLAAYYTSLSAGKRLKHSCVPAADGLLNWLWCGLLCLLKDPFFFFPGTVKMTFPLNFHFVIF